MRSELQERRLATLRADDAPPCPAQTRRRLAARLQELRPLAWRRQLERALLLALRRAYGIRLDQLTPGWQAALQYHLVADDNERLLSTLLRFAAGHPGRDAAAAMPRAQRWMERARQRFDVDAFRAPRRKELVLDGVRYTLATEQDPVEVMRMGIPFDTCLSLVEGVNAASTVVNALDPNKRVLYLRDDARNIVARKLLCVSQRFELLGYRLYSSLGEQHQEAINAAFDAMCREIADASRLPLASSGEPANVHGGFWYDDGVVAFAHGADTEALAAYCERFGRPLVDGVREAAQEARGWDALERCDAAGAIEALAGWPESPAEVELGDGIVSLLGEAAAQTQAAIAWSWCCQCCGQRPDAEPARSWQRQALGMHDSRMDDAVAKLAGLSPGADTARALARGARLAMVHPWDDDGLEHESLAALSEQAPFIDPRSLLEVCDEIQPAWDRVAANGCSDCRDQAVARLARAAEQVRARPRSRRGAPLSPRSTPRRDRAPDCAAPRRAVTLPRRGMKPAADAAGALPLPWSLTWLEEAPEASATAVGVIDKLLDHRPVLARGPDALAALLRHRARRERLARLPTADAPFEAIGALHLHLDDLGGLLERWSVPRAAPSAWKPSAWELYHLRRHATPWRLRLERAARRDSAEGRAAIDRLGLLGDEAALERLWLLLADRRGGEGSMAAVASAQRRAGAVVLQLRGSDDHARAAPVDMAWDATSLDPSFVRRALSIVRAALAGPDLSRATPDLQPAALEGALELLWIRDEPEQAWTTMEAILAAGPSDGPLVRYLSRVLRERSASWISSVPAELVVDAWQVPALRDDLCAAISRGADARRSGPRSRL